MSARRRWLAGATTFALAWSGAAASAAEERGIDPNLGESLVEVQLPSKAAAVRLQLEADTYGVDFNEHYLRRNSDGSVTATVFGTDDEIAALDAAGFELGVTIEGRSSWRGRLASARPTCGRSGARTPPRSTIPSSRRRRTRTRSSSCASTTSRTTPAASCPSRPRTATAARRPTRADLRRPDPLAVLEQRGGHADRFTAARDERRTSTRTRRPTPTSSIASCSGSATREPRRRRGRPASASARARARRSRRRSTRGSAAACRR